MNARMSLAVLFALGVTLVAGVAAGSAGAGDKATLVPIKYSTSFGTFGREAYAYVALERGYFRDAGFDVTITPGTGTTAVARLVASGQVDYGPGDTTAMVLARADGGLPVKCVSLIQQNILSAYLVRRSSGITSWKGFEEEDRRHPGLDRHHPVPVRREEGGARREQGDLRADDAADGSRPPRREAHRRLRPVRRRSADRPGRGRCERSAPCLHGHVRGPRADGQLPDGERLQDRQQSG